MPTPTKSRTRSQKRSAPKDVDEGEPSKVTKSANSLEFCKGERAECDNNQQGTGAGDGGGGEEGGAGVGSRRPTEQQMIQLRKVAERAFRSKHNESEATQATQIFGSLSKKWGLTTEVKNDMWRELEERYPELDRRKALKRMGRLLRQYWQRRKAILQELQKWEPWSEEKVDIGAVKLTERVDLRAAKYVLSLKEDEFKTLYLERAKKKAEVTAQRKKDGTIKEVKQKEIYKIIEADRKFMREMCIDFIKGRGCVQRPYNFKAPKTFGRRFARGLQGVWAAFKCALVNAHVYCPLRGWVHDGTLCTDFDMKNAHPTILLWVCTALGIECSKLRHYVEHRDKILQDMVNATGRPRAFCKDQFLISTNEGAPIYRSPFTFLNEYDLEMKSIHAALVNHSDYHWVREYVSEKEDNYNGSFVNTIMCYWENVLLEIAVKYFRDCGLEILVLMFDGLMVAQWKKTSQENNNY